MGMILLLPFLAPVRMTYDTHTQLSAACTAVCQRTGEIVVDRYSALQGRMQCTAGAVALHCRDGCSALRLRWAKGTPKSSVLFWIREKGKRLWHF